MQLEKPQLKSNDATFAWPIAWLKTREPPRVLSAFCVNYAILIVHTVAQERRLLVLILFYYTATKCTPAQVAFQISAAKYFTAGVRKSRLLSRNVLVAKVFTHRAMHCSQHSLTSLRPTCACSSKRIALLRRARPHFQQERRHHHQTTLADTICTVTASFPLPLIFRFSVQKST